MSTFGTRLKRLRINRDMTQQDFAEHFDLNKSSISKYEKDKNLPENQLLVEIADYFDVSVDYLLCRTDNPTSLNDAKLKSEGSLNSTEQLTKPMEMKDLLGLFGYAMVSAEGKKEILDFINFKHEVLVQHYSKKETE
ncbi:helix-turn-helix domain-containing protein [Acetobacterium paludosum]|uniref:Helix-turn-helix domain-containing protein n=2 Tax=Acetobacterium TaxID=33951 RepID=A0A923HVW1_9FIRM|nr:MULTISPECIES: helix-turn-helix transcriptional regulator [Acetobacterium]MBC3795897.1 helix-turn-helix domain-containing protein [Acetobacterium tundrae]MBC3886886.1 helix-turn-helix domain-containing protein [Acetobacterium paludosum]